MKLQTMILNKNYKIIFPFFYFLISLKISKAVSAGELAIGTDASPYLVFWNPNIQNHSVYSLSFPIVKLNTAPVTGLLSPCVNMLVSISKNGFIKNWNHANVSNIWDTNSTVEEDAIGLLSNGILIIGSYRGELRECDLYSGICQSSLVVHSSIIYAFENLHNGDLVTGSNDGYIKVWTPGNYITPTYRINFGSSVRSLKRLLNGYLACGLNDGRIEIYNISSQSLVIMYSAHSTSPVNALELLENGNLVSGSFYDQSIKIWDGLNFSFIGKLNQTGPVNALKLLSNNFLASGSEDKMVRVWNTSSLTKVNEVNVGRPVRTLELIKNNTCLSTSTPTMKNTATEPYTTASIKINTTSAITSIFTISTNKSLIMELFSLNQLSSSKTLELLNSNSDTIGCLVNCTSHGICVFDTLKNGYKCACREHYSGLSCQLDTRACSSSPCLNNATCVDVYSNSTTNSSLLVYSRFNCECQKGFEGVYCENKINVCANETCYGNGNCVNKNNKPKCKCFNMYEGEKCSVQSSELKTIKSLISMSSILAIIVIVCFYLLILVMDFLKYFTRRRVKERKKETITKYVYIN